MNDDHEIVRAYDVGPHDPLPCDDALRALSGVAAVGAPTQARLVATYLDAGDLSLLRDGVTLRRRVGGADEGWHLSVASGEGRDEIHRPLGSPRSAGRAPVSLARLVTGWSRGRTLAPVAEIETVRTTRLLLDADGGVVAGLCDETVVGRPADGSAPLAWREVEVELGPTAAGSWSPAEVDALFAAAGVAPRTEQRKVATVLAHRLVAYDAPPEPTLDGPAGAVLHTRLVELVTELRRRDCDVRRRVPDGVHQLRVTCRRLRGALATYRPLLERSRTDPIRDELRWLARTLGDGRDAEVALERLRGLVDEQPPTSVLGPVRRRLNRHYAARLRAAGGHADAILGSRRYLRLLAWLDDLTTRPPFTEEAGRPARTVMPPRVRRDVERLRRLVGLAVSSPDAERDEALHEVRKAAKRLRYACETLEPTWGAEAKALRKAARSVTQLLGERQDAAVALGDLRRVAAEAAAAGEHTFSYGLLYAEQQARAAALEAAFEQLWEEAERTQLRAWTG